VVAASPLELHVWDSDTGKEVKQIKLTSARSIAFSPARPVVAIAAGEWDGLESSKVRPYKEFSTADWSEIPLNDAPSALEVAFSGEGDLVLVTTEGIRLAAQKKELPNTRGCRSIRFDAAGGFVSMCPEGLSTFKIADGSSQRLRVDRSISRELSAVSVTSFEGRHPRDLYLAHLASSGVVSAFDEDGAEYLRLPEPVTSMAVPSSGSWMASGNVAGEVAFWRLARGLAPPPLAYLGKAYQGIVTDLTFSHDEEWLALAQPDGLIRVFDTATGQQIHEVQLAARPRLPQFSPDDSVLAVLYADDLRLIRTPKGRSGGSNRTQEWSILEADLKAPKPQPRLSFSFSLDSHSLIIAEGARVKRYRLSPTRTSVTALPPIVLKNEEDDITVSADREWLAVVDTDGAQPAHTSFWNVTTGLLTAPETNALLRAAAPSDLKLPKWIKLRPANEASLSGDANGGDWWTVDLDILNSTSPILKITERVTGHLVAELEHPSDVNALAISRQGNWIAAVTRADKAVFLWPWSQDGLIALACGLVPGNLTPETWKERHLEELGLGPYRPTCP
jgi:WD40 repeat protein